MEVSSVTTLRFDNNHLPPTEGDVLVSIDDISKPSKDDDPTMMNLNVMSDKWLIAQILYVKRNGSANNKSKGASLFSKAKGDTTVSYERMLMMRCLSTTSASSNTFAILLGKGKNSKIYDGFIQGRDMGNYKPGTIVAIVSPPFIENWLGETGNGSPLPLLDVPGTFKVVLPKSVPLKTVPSLDSVDNFQSFHYSKVKLGIQNLSIIEANCSGLLCGGLDVYKSGRIVDACPCFKVNVRSGHIYLLVDIVAFAEDPNVGTVKIASHNFTSRDFTMLWLTDNGIPPGLSASSMNNRTDKVKAFKAKIASAINIINESDGFNVTGWARRGFILDQGAISSEDATSRARSGDLNYHLTTIKLNKESEALKKIESFLTNFDTFLDNDADSSPADATTNNSKASANEAGVTLNSKLE